MKWYARPKEAKQIESLIDKNISKFLVKECKHYRGITMANTVHYT